MDLVHLQSVSEKFPYLVSRKLKEGAEIRRVAQLDYKIIEDSTDKPFIASGLHFVPLPVSFVILNTLNYHNIF